MKDLLNLAKKRILRIDLRILSLICVFLICLWVGFGLEDLASVSAIIALVVTMLSLNHSATSLQETKAQIERSNIKSVASIFLSKLESIFQSISYRQEQNLSDSAVGRAAIMEALPWTADITTIFP